MNAILVEQRINFYCDVTRNGRFTRPEIDMAVNDAMADFIDQQLGDPLHRDPNNFQWVQLVRENLYSIISSATPSVTNGTAITNRYYSIIPSHINFPADYYSFVTLMCTIDSYTTYARPTTYNLNGPLFEDSFRHPTNNKPYFNEDSTGLKVYRGSSGTFSTATLEYIRNTADFTIGPQARLIDAGGTLTNATAYIATEISVYAGTTYAIGATITGTGVALTSGQVILTSLTTTIDLPSKTHEVIAQMAAARLLKVSGNYPASQAVDQEVKG